MEQAGEATSLAAAFAGHATVVIVDAAHSGVVAGTIRRLEAGQAPLPAEAGSLSSHGLGVAAAIEMARVLGTLPAQVVVFGIEGKSFGVGDDLSSEVLASIPRVVEAVLREVAVEEATHFVMRPVAVVRSPFLSDVEIPKGPGAEHRAEGVLEILPEFAAGLQDIEGFSHLYVLWVFHAAGGGELLVTPPTDDRPHGVFATRAPRRPNPLGLTVVELLGRDGPRLRVRGVDMLDGTPVLDIKPYLSSIPADAIRRGWLGEAEARRKG